MSSRTHLPPVDPDFLIVEHRPERLHAYAHGLLQQLREIRAREHASGYPINTIKAAATWLIQAYAEAGTAPCQEAALLIREIVRPNPDASTLPVRRSSEAAYRAAIEFEGRHPPDPTGKAPSNATIYAVAKHVLGLLQNRNSSQKTSEGIVRNWRKQSHNRTNVLFQRTETP